MKRRYFLEDLRRWEEGEITSSLLKARHPGKDVEGLTELYAQMQALAEEPVADMVPSWNEVRSRMASRRQAAPQTLLQRLKPGVHRRLALGVAAALLALPPVAFAATSDSLRDSVGDLVGSVFVIGDETAGDGQAAGTGEGSASQTSADNDASSTDSGGSSQSDEGGQAGSLLRTVQGTAGTSGQSASNSVGGGSGAPAASGATGSEGKGDDLQSSVADGGADGDSTPGSAATSGDGTDAAPTPIPAPSPSPSPATATAPQP